MSDYPRFFFLVLTLVLIALAVFSMGSAAGAEAENTSAEAIPVKVLILPKFELGQCPEIPRERRSTTTNTIFWTGRRATVSRTAQR